MRHKVDHRKLGRTRAHRKAMLANMVTSLFDKERITTTDAKAKEARRSAERLITRAKKGYAAYKKHESLKEAGKEAEAQQARSDALAHWRQASRVIRKRTILKKLFDEIAPQYLEREGGYTRILHLGNRPGDNAKRVLLELVESEVAAGSAERTGRKSASTKTVTDAGSAEKPAKKASAKKKAAPEKALEEQEAAAAPEEEAASEAKAPVETETTPEEKKKDK